VLTGSHRQPSGCHVTGTSGSGLPLEARPYAGLRHGPHHLVWTAPHQVRLQTRLGSPSPSGDGRIPRRSGRGLTATIDTTSGLLSVTVEAADITRRATPTWRRLADSTAGTASMPRCTELRLGAMARYRHPHAAANRIMARRGAHARRLETAARPRTCRRVGGRRCRCCRTIGCAQLRKVYKFAAPLVSTSPKGWRQRSDSVRRCFRAKPQRVQWNVPSSTSAFGDGRSATTL
jgi:hypothetical protein